MWKFHVWRLKLARQCLRRACGGPGAVTHPSAKQLTASNALPAITPTSAFSKYPVIGGAWGGRVALWEDDPDVVAVDDSDEEQQHGGANEITAVDALVAKHRPTPPRKPKVPVTVATAGLQTPRHEQVCCHRWTAGVIRTGRTSLRL